MTTRKDKRRALKSKKQKNEKGDGTPCAKKSLGQNFLDDELFLEMIAKAADLKKEDNILEIGPGTGLLTDQLIKMPKKVICIEKDHRMVQFLNTKYDTNNYIQNKKIQIVEADITKVDLPKFLKENNFCDYKVVANIPYYITGKIFRLLLETEIQPKQIVLLIQKEVAQRVSNKPGSMNILAVAVQYYADVELLAVVPRTAFEPTPKVDSAIISVKPFADGKREMGEKEKEFFKVVKSGFSSPRKKLLSNLVAGLKKDKNELLAIFNEFGWNQNIRAQNLTIEQWKELRDRIFC
jgi:16S rRNA (adenine1518-N6/adenine1519-N6)-dimethyltransferase